MAFALTKVRGYGVEAEEALNKRYRQYLILNITGANTDVDLDIGDYTSGTFWTAIGTSATAAAALLAALKDIQTRAEAFLGVQGTGIATRQQVDASRTIVTALDSSASAGGSATETLTVTGLLTTDTVLGATIVEDGANSVYIREAAKTCAVNGQYIVTFSGDPGAGLELRVSLSRASTTPEAGTYQVALDGTNTLIPNILFASGDAPTSYRLVLSWILKDGQVPVEVDATTGT